MSEEKAPLEIDETVQREPNVNYVCIEGVLLPRNPDGSLQFNEHTSIAPEDAEGLLQRLKESAEVTLQRLKETEVDAIMADMEKLQERAVTEGVPTLKLSARDSKTLQEALQEPWEPTPELQSELDMLQEGCPHHDPVD